jgi:hypothetical protein
MRGASFSINSTAENLPRSIVCSASNGTGKVLLDIEGGCFPRDNQPSRYTKSSRGATWQRRPRHRPRGPQLCSHHTLGYEMDAQALSVGNCPGLRGYAGRQRFGPQGTSPRRTPYPRLCSSQRRSSSALLNPSHCLSFATSHSSIRCGSIGDFLLVCVVVVRTGVDPSHFSMYDPFAT